MGEAYGVVQARVFKSVSYYKKNREPLQTVTFLVIQVYPKLFPLWQLASYRSYACTHMCFGVQFTVNNYVDIDMSSGVSCGIKQR